MQHSLNQILGRKDTGMKKKPRKKVKQLSTQINRNGI